MASDVASGYLRFAFSNFRDSSQTRCSTRGCSASVMPSKLMSTGSLLDARVARGAEVRSAAAAGETRLRAGQAAGRPGGAARGRGPHARARQVGARARR
eukprot:5903002-Pleurochrysis_carterae.AAC.1